MDKGFSKTENRKVKRRRYTVEFKKEAVKCVILEGQDAQEVAERLGVSSSLLYRWKREYLEEQAESPQGEQADPMSPKEMAQELARLRKQLRESQQVNEILKKTVGYFAQEDRGGTN